MTDLKKVVAGLPWIGEPGGVCLIGQRLPGIALENHWEAPGGTRRENETEEGCLFREYNEEFPGFEFEIIRRVGENKTGRIHLVLYEVVYTGGGFFPQAHSNIALPRIDEILGRYDPVAPADIPLLREIRERYAA
ncbi:MAG TPA: hypothetical protein ENH99_00040 [Candidatus Pacearchaeota archaeon]|nr:hypothetical protein [Candidatus Pacearchaeota archaeon]